MKLLKLYYNDRQISKKYLRLAATYRRFGGSGFDYSPEMLIECFAFESFGIPPLGKLNGYINGKWMKDITVSTWIEDIQKGDATKSEFIYIHSVDCVSFDLNFNRNLLSRNGWWAINALSAVQVPSSGCFSYN